MMFGSKRKRIVIGGIILALLLIAAGAVIWFTQAKEQEPTEPTKPTQQAPVVSEPNEEKITYEGKSVTIGTRGTTVKVPNGWQASVSESVNFMAVMFAEPSKIDTLRYSSEARAEVSYSGIPAWSGLTEHFFIQVVTDDSRNFDPALHQQVTSEPFTFDDGTIGERYLVTKNAEEAANWGGLLKDNEWYGRTYIYVKGDERVEAHLALYPSTDIDIDFFEAVIRTIHL